MSKQEYFRKEYARKNPEWKDSLALYGEIVDQYVLGAQMLDIGCGHADFLKYLYQKAESVYGVDIDPIALKKNVVIKNKMVGTIEELPYRNNVFDLVICSWVFEHLKSPEVAMKEVYRVLKSGGSFIFLTPNLLNYNTWPSLWVPNIFHNFLTKKLYGRQEGDTYPTYYRLNTPNKIKTMLKRLGFKEMGIVLNDDPSYISFNSTLFKFACLLESIIGEYFLSAKVHIIGVYKK